MRWDQMVEPKEQGKRRRGGESGGNGTRGERGVEGNADADDMDLIPGGIETCEEDGEEELGLGYTCDARDGDYKIFGSWLAGSGLSIPVQ